MSHKRYSRWALAIVAAMMIAACGGGAPAAEEPAEEPTAVVMPTAASIVEEPTAAPEPTAVPQPINGVTLPEDAAPADQQVITEYFDSTAAFESLDFLVTVYNGGGGAFRDLASDSLIRLDKNFRLLPGAALEWTPNADGTEWTFKLDPNLMWNDGTPVTAADWVASFQYAANKDHAWDFAWYYSAPGAIKNWDKVGAGEVPDTDLGVIAVDANTLVFQTETPAPFLPAKLLYSAPLQKAALEKYGPLYNNDPATSVSSGPFRLVEWTKGEKVVWEANPDYKGTNKPLIQKLVSIAAKPETYFIGYRNGEIDRLGGEFIGAAETEIIAGDPDLQAQQYTNAVDFRTDYLFFDTTSAPFDNLKVRQAFSHLVDRDTLIADILGKAQAIPAYSFLMPGFHASNSDGLKDIQAWDPEKGKALLAEAGYPDGAGFPKLTLWLRAESQNRIDAANRICADIKANLNVDCEVSNKERKVFMEALNAKPTQIQFGMVSYGIDYFDASNMLGVFRSGGRHSWTNEAYDKLVDEASASTDTEGRLKQFQDAERILVEDASAIFIVHRINTGLIKPYLAGEALAPNDAGFNGIQWPGISTYSNVLSTLYIHKSVADYKAAP